jgi:hypothetical protein
MFGEIYWLVYFCHVNFDSLNAGKNRFYFY